MHLSMKSLVQIFLCVKKSPRCKRSHCSRSGLNIVTVYINEASIFFKLRRSPAFFTAESLTLYFLCVQAMGDAIETSALSLPSEIS